MNDFEATVLGACFLADGVDEVLAMVKPEDFSIEIHRSIFEAIKDTTDHGAIPDIVTVTNRLREKGVKNFAGYLAEIVEYTPTASNIRFYADKLKDAGVRSRLVEMAAQILNLKELPGKELLEIVHQTLNVYDDETKTEKAGHILKTVLKSMEERHMRRGQLLGYSTGLESLDRMTSGFCDGDMIVLAARPSIGKTALALNIMEAVAIRKEIPSLFFSLEMTPDKLIERQMLTMGRIDSGKARIGLFEPHEFSAMTRCGEMIHKAPLWVEKSSGYSMDQIKARARAAKRRYGIKFIAIDYLGLVKGKGTEYEVVTEASKEVKRMAVELDLPVLCLHQLNRGNENRSDKTPTMADLRSSGQIEQDADVILFIHRDKKEPIEEALLIVEKQRNGPTGKIKVNWHGSHNRFFEGG